MTATHAGHAQDGLAEWGATEQAGESSDLWLHGSRYYCFSRGPASDTSREFYDGARGNEHG
jgi:hypothetical protein